MKKVTIEARSIQSKKARTQISELTGAVKFTKRHVPGMGYVLYCKNSAGQNIAFGVQSTNGIVVTIK